MPRPTGEGRGHSPTGYFIAVARLRSYAKPPGGLFITRARRSAEPCYNLEQELGETLIAQRDSTLGPLKPGGRSWPTPSRSWTSTAPWSGATWEKRPAAGCLPLLSVSLVPGAALTLPRTIIDRFADEHPNLLLSVESSPTDIALAMVKTGESDIGIVGSAPQYLTDFDALQLVETGTYVHVPVANPLSRRERLGAHDLDGQPFVTFGKRDHLHRFFMDTCADLGIEAERTHDHLQRRPAHGLLSADRALSCSALPPNGAIITFPDYPLVPVDLRPDVSFGTYAVKRKGEPAPPPKPSGTTSPGSRGA